MFPLLNLKVLSYRLFYLHEHCPWEIGRRAGLFVLVLEMRRKQSWGPTQGYAISIRTPHHTLSAFSVFGLAPAPPYKQAVVGASPPFENIHIHVFEVSHGYGHGLRCVEKRGAANRMIKTTERK